MSKPSVKEQAQAFAKAAAEYGFSWEVRSNSQIMIFAQFPINDKEAFTKLDMMASSVLAHAPHKGGSVWGTDGGSVGGQVALQSGRFEMKKTGDGAVNFTKALLKLKK